MMKHKYNVVLIFFLFVGCTTAERREAPQSDTHSIDRSPKTQIRNIGT